MQAGVTGKARKQYSPLMCNTFFDAGDDDGNTHIMGPGIGGELPMAGEY